MELLLALVLTCIIEAAVTFVIIWICRKRMIMIYYNLLCNLLTNPLLNLGLYGAFCLGAGRELITVLTVMGEICVVAAEYGLYRLMSGETRKLCFILALITNVISYLSGFVLL
ncbi:MAG: hypothetical protein J5824_07870 [Lachnospiraceae bacterium]|nr:hypothetical protein [Lachnospiraceae bacterium]